jgi:hypothetical protein
MVLALAASACGTGAEAVHHDAAAGSGGGGAGASGGAGTTAGASGTSAGGGASGSAGSGVAGTSQAGADGGVDVPPLPVGDGSAPDVPPGTVARFIIVGYAGRRIASADGMSWTESPLVTKPPWGNGATIQPVDGDNEWILRGVCYGNGLFIAVGGNGTNGMMLTSPDGYNWEVNPKSQTNDGCAYGNGVYVTQSLWSTDGKTWTHNTKQPTGSRVLKFGVGKFVAVGDATGNVSYTTDGKAWTELPIKYTGNLGDGKGYNDLTFGNGHFYAIKSGTGHQFFEWDGVSDTSFTETPLSSIIGTDDPLGILYGGGHLLIEGNGFYYDRPDGSTTWTRHTVTYKDTASGNTLSIPLELAAYSNGIFASPTAWTSDLVNFKSPGPIMNDQYAGAQKKPGWVRALGRP